MDETKESLSPERNGAEKDAAEPPLSQAALDLAGIPHDAGTEAAAREAAKKPGGRDDGAPVSRFRWALLLVISLAGLLFWVVEAQIGTRPYRWPSLGFLVLALAVTFGTGRFLRLPTRAGLCAFIWGLTFYVSALYGPSEKMFGDAPAGLGWAMMLTLALLWLALAVWRKVGRCKIPAVILGLLLLYGALGPVLALGRLLVTGRPLALSFAYLTHSPAFLTGHLPWYLWPTAVTVGLLLPMAALFALWDQATVLKRPGGRHGGDFFLALAFLALMPYGFLSQDEAVAANGPWVAVLRAPYPAAAVHARENQKPPAVTEAAAPEARPAPAAENQPTAAPTETPPPLPLETAPETPPVPAAAEPQPTPAPQPLISEEPPSVSPPIAPLPIAPPPIAPPAPAVPAPGLEERLSGLENQMRLMNQEILELRDLLRQRQNHGQSAPVFPGAPAPAPEPWAAPPKLPAPPDADRTDSGGPGLGHTDQTRDVPPVESLVPDRDSEPAHWPVQEEAGYIIRL